MKLREDGRDPRNVADGKSGDYGQLGNTLAATHPLEPFEFSDELLVGMGL
jgi:hypothetical protein